MHEALFPNNDIIIKQCNYPNTSCQVCCCCVPFPSDLFRYSYVAPTPILQQRGLTPQALQQEIQYIETIANQAAQSSNTKIIGIIAILSCFAFSVGMFIFWRDLQNYDDCAACPLNYTGLIIMIAGSILLIICWCCNITRKRNAFFNALHLIRQYVEIELNAKYQQTNGIRWSIIQGQFMVVSTYSGQQVGTRKSNHYHIGITCVAKNNAPAAVIVYTEYSLNNNDSVDIQQEQQSVQSSLVPCEYGGDEEGDHAVM